MSKLLPGLNGSTGWPESSLEERKKSSFWHVATLRVTLCYVVGYDTYKAYFGVEGMTVDYVADQMSIFEIPDIEDLESKTAASIDRIRKADISIR